ncbi:MAG TPA: subclass B3 metallo-beta-lactamase [Lacunisphaera sp.]|nr:subclass B3 metallo-beta-lactamase [Lacunisphaera sp.]
MNLSTPPVHRAILVLACCLGGWVNLAAAGPAPAVAPSPTRAWVEQLFGALKAPIPPRHLVGPIHYVGVSGVSSFLITTPAGHILLDTGFADTEPRVEHSVEQLGFKLADIKFILSSHAHVDHVGGHAAMQKLTGAQVVASAADARLLESGGADDFLAWPRDTLAFAPVHVDRIVGDGDSVSLGGVTLTAHLTPGHTRGATTWTMDATDGGRTYHVVFFSSTTVNPGTSLVLHPAYPGIVADYERTFAALKALPCDIFFAPHGSQFDLAGKFARQDRGEGVAAFVDPEGWHKLLATVEGAFRDQLVAEQAAAK